MESARWLVLSPLAVALAAGALAPGRLAGTPADGTAWDPPPCAAEAAGPPTPGAWYRLDPLLDRTGTLVARRLVVGTDGSPGRAVDLAPESFASGPAGGLVLAGEDDGSASRLRLLDPARGCGREVAREPSVVRSAVLAPGGRVLYEHRVDRATRADQGIWRREVAGGAAVRVLDGLAADSRLGPTFVTDLVLAADGRLAVSSCAPGGCRVRVLDPATGRVTPVAGTGPALGLTGGWLVVRASCDGWPCAVDAVDLASSDRRTLASWAYAAAIASDRLVAEVAGGRLVTVEIASGRTSPAIAADGVPMRGGSTATAGAEAAPGRVPLAPSGRPGSRPLRQLDPRTGTVPVGPETAR